MRINVDVNVVSDGLDLGSVERAVAEEVFNAIDQLVNNRLKTRFGKNLRIESPRVTVDTGWR